MNIYSKLTFNEFIKKCRVLRTRYAEFLTPFFDEKEIKKWRNFVYSLNFSNWRKDKIWEYFNYDIEMEELVRIALLNTKNGN